MARGASAEVGQLTTDIDLYRAAKLYIDRTANRLRRKRARSWRTQVIFDR